MFIKSPVILSALVIAAVAAQADPSNIAASASSSQPNLFEKPPVKRAATFSDISSLLPKSSMSVDQPPSSVNDPTPSVSLPAN